MIIDMINDHRYGDCVAIISISKFPIFFFPWCVSIAYFLKRVGIIKTKKRRGMIHEGEK